MFIKLRKQLNQQQTGGNVLDSPNANATVASVNAPNIEPAPVVVPPVEPTPTPDSVVVDPANPNPQPIVSAEPVDKQWYQEVVELVGIDLGENIEIPDSIEGIAELVNKGGEVFAKNAVEKEYQELSVKAPAGLELTRWQLNNPGRDEREFYASKLGTPTIDADKIDEKDTNTHKDILVKDFINKGLSASLADTMANNLIDSNASFDAVKEILKDNAIRETAQRAEREAENNRKAQERYDAFVRDIQQRENTVRNVGKLGNVVIPTTEREAYINANYYDAGNTEYPNMSVIDIKMAQMSPEQKDLYRYLVWKDLNVSSLVIAREQTKTVTGMLNKGTTATSRMSGGGNKVDTNTNNNKLDSPGS